MLLNFYALFRLLDLNMLKTSSESIFSISRMILFGLFLVVSMECMTGIHVGQQNRLQV